MPKFRVNNLTVSLGQQIEQVQGTIYCTIGTTPRPTLPPTNGCPPLTFWPPRSYDCCFNFITHCPPNTWVGCQHTTHPDCLPMTDFCLGSTDCGVFSPLVQVEQTAQLVGQQGDIEGLEFFRNKLAETLAKVDEQCAELDKAMKPQTLEEADQLEQQLTAALKEVQNLKKGMQ